MKILMFGRGVISTQYGWAFEKAGHDVTFYVRTGRSTEYVPIVNLDILDGRKNSKGDSVKEEWPITMREELNSGHSYDLIIISVNHNQLESATQYIGPRTGDATVLIFNNVWDELKTIEAHFPQGQVLWGFPGGGGGYYDRNTLRGGFLKMMFLGSPEMASFQKRHSQIVRLFEDSGFSVSRIKDIQNWLWGHFIMNAALSAEALKAGGHGKVFASKAAVRELLALMREMLPLIKAKGGKTDFLTKLLTAMPSALSVLLLQKTSAEESLSGELLSHIDRSGHASKEMNLEYIKPIIEDAERFRIALPKLMELKPFCE
jgi:2-dehydropantoate 2-reductase